MKKLMLTLPVIVILSVNTSFADTTPLKIFVGANAAYNTVTWGKPVRDIEKLLDTDFAEANLGLGIEAGIKYAPDEIYNLGFTFNYDYMFDSSAVISDAAEPFLSEIETGFSAIGLSFDNYIRFANDNNKRSDLVFGIGLARVTERGELTPTTLGYVNGLNHTKFSDDGSALMFKVAYNQEMTENIDLVFAIRIFGMDGKKGDIESIVNISAGVRYNF